MKTVLANVVLFQVAWFASVLGAARGMPWVGLVAVALAAAWHLANARERTPELKLLLLALGIGALFETLLVQSGWLRSGTGVWIAGTASAWMVALWANFATTLNVSLRSLRGRPGIAACLGAIGAPIAYYSGSRLGAVELVDARSALIAIGAGWLLVTPLLFMAARRLDGYALR